MLTSPLAKTRNSQVTSASANAQLVNRDVQLVGLKNLLEPQLLACDIADLLKTNSPIDVRVSYLRYKPHRRCIALLQIFNGSSCELVTATAMTDQSWLKWMQNRNFDSVAGNVRNVDACRIRMERFPGDCELKYIARLYHQSTRRKLLRRILPTQLSSHHVSTEDVRIERLAYKPARRLVVGVNVNNALRYTVKFHSKSSFRLAAQRMLIGKSLALPDIGSPHCCERYQAISTAWVPGQNLATLMSDWHRCLPPDLLREVGRKLAELHKTKLHAGLELPVENATQMTGKLRSLENDLTFLYPPQTDEVRRVIRATSERIPLNGPLSLIHGDFYAKQVIVDDQTVRFIDFDAISIGHPWQDVGNFVAKLHWNCVRGLLSEEQLRTSVEHFLSGYRSQCPWDDRAFQCFLAVGLLQSLPHAFRQAAGDWPRLFARLLALASDALCSERLNGAPPKNSLGHEFTTSLLATERVRFALGQSTTKLEPAISRLHFLNAHTLRLKAGKRCLLECRFAGSLSSDRFNAEQAWADMLPVLGKVRFKGMDHRTPKLHQELQVAGFDERSPNRVPRYLGVVPSVNMWLQEKVDARPVTPDSRTTPETHAHVARCLAALHTSGICVDRIHTLDDELRTLEWRLSEVADRYSEWQAEIGIVLRSCEALAAELPPAKTCLIHRDFYFDQVLHNGPQITLLDLDLAAMGPPELDAGNYIAHLHEFGIRSPKQAEYCQQAAHYFESAYVNINPAAQRSAISVWTTLALARHIWISTLFEDRQHTTRELLTVLGTMLRLTQKHP